MTCMLKLNIFGKIRCLGCERHVGKGTRFNTKKDKDGKYFSTTIFSFSMKVCDNAMVFENLTVMLTM